MGIDTICHQLVLTRKPQESRSFLNSVEKAVVHEGYSDTWEFGKGALSANVYFSTTTPE
jgi:hypothetical protein